MSAAQTVGVLVLSVAFGAPPAPFPPRAVAPTFALPAVPCTGDGCVSVPLEGLLRAGQELYNAGKRDALIQCGRAV